MAKLGLKATASSSPLSDATSSFAQPEGPTHGPVRSRIARVCLRAVAGSIESLIDLRAAGASVLDVGCGSGLLARQLRAAGFAVRGVMHRRR